MQINLLIIAYFGCILVGNNFVIAAESGSTDDKNTKVKSQLIQVNKLIKNKNYKKTIKILNGLLEKHPREADIYNLLGYSYRKLKNYTQAEQNYKRALRLAPNHKGALEYLGELFLETGRRAEAKKLLSHLELLCKTGCDELKDLQEAFSNSK